MVLILSTPQYLHVKDRGVYGRLFKIHGSLNWLYCEKCSRLDLFVSEGLNGLRTSKALEISCIMKHLSTMLIVAEVPIVATRDATVL